MPARRATGLTAAFVLGSLFPDADALLVFRGFDAYLRAHASGTHSLLGTIAGAVIVGVTLRLLLSGARLVPLVAAAWVGTLGHVVCDLADGSDIRVLAPFSSAVFGWHLVAMGEPIVLAILAGGLIAAWRRPAYRRSIAAVALILLMSVLAFKKTTQARAISLFAQHEATTSDTIAVAPKIAALFQWTVVERRDDRVRAWTIDTRTDAMSLDFEFRDAARSESIDRSRRLPVVHTFLGLSRMPFVRTESDGGRRLVLWSDASACSPRGCDVSFGGAFDAAAAPLYQLIRIGGFSEMRPVPAALP